MTKPVAILLIKLVQFQCNITFLVWQKISLKIVRSGLVYLISAGTFRAAGVGGYYWSSRAGANNIWDSAGLGGYYLYFDATGVNPSVGPDYHWYGFPLRCLSTVLDM